MKTLKYMMAAVVLQAACMAVADMIPGDWRVDVGKRSVFRKELYQGESVRLEATFFRDGKEFTPDFAAPMLYWQTNGMGRSYFSAPAVASSNAVCAVWDGSKDCGARYYHGFIGETGVTYRAEFEFKMVPSPGFVPNEIPLPVQMLDFAALEIVNAPYYTRAETDDRIIALSPPADLSAATNYTDSAQRAFAATGTVYRATMLRKGNQNGEVGVLYDFSRSRLALYDEDAWVYPLAYFEDIAAASAAATNYTDSATNEVLRASNVFAQWLTDNASLAATNYTDSATAAATNALVTALEIGQARMVYSNGVERVYSTTGGVNRLVYEWDSAYSNRFNEVSAAVLSAIRARAPSDWANWAASGVSNTTEGVMLDKPLVIGDGSVVWEATNGFYALSASSPFIANAQGGALRIAANADDWFGLESAATAIVGTTTDGIAIITNGATATLQLTYTNAVAYGYATTPPVIYWTTNLAREFTQWTQLTDIAYSVSGDTLTVTITGAPATGAYFYAKRQIAIGAVFRSTLPILADGYVVYEGGVPQIVQPDAVITITSGGKTYRVMAQEVTE